MAEMLNGRLNFRLTDEQEGALRQAAALTGQTVTGFVLSTAVEHAHEVLERANHIELSATHFRRFVTEVDKPAEAVPELVKLFSRKSRIPTARANRAFAPSSRTIVERRTLASAR